MNSTAELETLPDTWRARAQQLQDWGSGEGLARAWELAAIELEQSLRQQQDDTLNLRDAARESGYSADHLGELVRQGKIPNVGRRNAPRIRRADLPIKRQPQRRISETTEITADDLR